MGINSDHDELGQFILPVMTALADGHPICVGSSVIITTAKRRAIALTAKHVIDYVEQLNGRDDTTEFNVAPHFRKRRTDEVFKPRPARENHTFKHEVFVMIPDAQSLAVAMKICLFPGGELDVAALGLEIGIGPAQSFPMRCRIMSNGPAIGDEVVLCGFPQGNSGSFNRATGTFEFNYKIQTLRGTVVERFSWSEDYFVRSPGFRINVGAPSGFSGGAVLYVHQSLGPVLCGVISASDEQRTSAALLYPALGLSNPISHDSSVPDTILGLCSLPDALHDLDDAAAHVSIDKNGTHNRLSDYITWRE